MAYAEARLGGRSYRIDCSLEQVDRLKRLIEIVEARAAALEGSGAAAVAPEGEDPELRFLLLTSLLVADLQLKAEEALEATEAELETRETRETIEQRAIASNPEAVEEAEIVFSDASSSPAADTAADSFEETVRDDGDLGLDPEVEAALAELFDSAAERMNAAAEALERL